MKGLEKNKFRNRNFCNLDVWRTPICRALKIFLSEKLFQGWLTQIFNVNLWATKWSMKATLKRIQANIFITPRIFANIARSSNRINPRPIRNRQTINCDIHQCEGKTFHTPLRFPPSQQFLNDVLLTRPNRFRMWRCLRPACFKKNNAKSANVEQLVRSASRNFCDANGDAAEREAV